MLHHSAVVALSSVKYGSLAVLLMVLAACSGHVEPAAILLTPLDFPDLHLQTGRPADPSLATSEHSAETVLIGDGYKIYHTVVALEDSKAAEQMLRDLRSNLEPLGQKVAEAPIIGEEAVGIIRDRSLTNRIFLVFREGRLLVRLTLEGDGTSADLAVFANVAWQKAK